MKLNTPLTTECAIRTLLLDHEVRERLVASYLTRSVREDAEAFATSGEFAEVVRLLGGSVHGKVVVDLGAGRGVASHAFVRAGAKIVHSVEPDPSDLVGYGALKQLTTIDRINIVPSCGESLPLETGIADVVYIRQVLHHAHNLESLVAECYRMLRPGGVFIATREHVVDNDEDLKEFLANHPIHQLAGGEYAYSIDRYVRALQEAGFAGIRVVKPWDSVINAFPFVRTQEELDLYLREKVRSRFGRLGDIAARLLLVRRLYVWRLNASRAPGRLCSFVGIKTKQE